MIITVDEIVQSTTAGFAEKYPHFKDFISKEQWFPYWKLCVQALQDRDLLGHIIFCNDLFSIPPVKTFLCYYAEELKAITGREDARLDDYAKKAIGAVWGYVFKVVFDYAGQKSVSVSLNKQFMLKTATCYGNPQKKLVLAY
ncbi:hypothetical protein LJC60_01475 [Ruminococcaceae bacterium OttesenSCG-928-D13]|nr:hypothetical protein [Ruminococcaceae bacterium OttesenSCG-928-D13]